MYTRKFIILKKELSTMGGNPKGHCKLEAKGNRGIMSVNIENAEKDHFYNMVFLCHDNEVYSTWELGKIFTDSTGRGRGEYVFTQRELESMGLSVDNIVGILVTRYKDILMGGYIDREDGSIERYIKIEKPESEELIQEEETKEDIEEPFVEEQSEANTMDLEDIEEIVDIEQPPLENQEERLTMEDESDFKTLDYIKKLNQKNQRTSYALNILRFFPYIDPFSYDLKGHNWWSIELNKENEYKNFLPYSNYIIGGISERIERLIDKYGHYLFGLYNRDEEVKYFIYGIPGAFIEDEKPEDRFHIWYQGLNVEGYWIIYIDPITGKTIQHPIPMEPMD